MSGVGTGIALAAGLGVAGSVGGAAIASSAAGNAADTQAHAADTAAELQAQEAQNALNFQEKEWNTQQKNLAPWLTEGKTALSNLSGLLNTPGKGLLTPWTQTFTPPTLAEAEQYPGYKFQLDQGEKALTNAGAASGDIGGGNTQEALTKFAQNYAQNDYTNVYNEALQRYQQNYGIFENNQTNTYNRLAGLAGTGQTAATTLGAEGQQAANTNAQIDLTTGAQQGQDIQNAGAAEASGYIGSANAWGGAFSGTSNNLTQLALLNSLYGSGGGGTNYAADGLTGNPYADVPGVSTDGYSG